MNFNLQKLIQVMAENCPNETLAMFIATYGVFFITAIIILVLVIRLAKKNNANANDTNKCSIAIEEVKNQASKIAVDNLASSNAIKEEIKANNDTTMQLFIALAMQMGMSYTDITNIITKSKEVYAVSKEQYEALEQQAQTKLEEQEKANAEALAKANAEKEAYNNDLASIKL